MVNIYKILHVCVPHFLLSLSVIWLLYMCYQRMHYTYYIKLKAYFFVYYPFWYNSIRVLISPKLLIILRKTPGDIIRVIAVICTRSTDKQDDTEIYSFCYVYLSIECTSEPINV